MSHWLDVSGETGMPIDPRLWRRNPIASTYPACQAVEAAAEQGPELAYAYLRRLREGLMCGLKKLDQTEALVGEAGPAGLDVERFESTSARTRSRRASPPTSTRSATHRTLPARPAR
jgi:putative protein-disulfide isomerase